MIDFDHFSKIDMRIGRIIKVEQFPQARKPAFKLWIDFGSVGIKQSSAQITQLYTQEDLIGKLVVGVVNFPPKTIAGFSSEVLILGTEVADHQVQLLDPGPNAIIGSRVF